MKRVLLLAVLLGCAALQAQNIENDNKQVVIPKGIWNLAGDVSIGVRDMEITGGSIGSESDRFTFFVSPRIGYAFAENWILGVKTGYGFSKVDGESPNNFEAQNETITVAPYVKRYFSLSNKLLFQLQGELGYDASWTKDEGANSQRSTSSTDRLYVAFRPGISFFVSEKLAFESSIGALQYSNFKREVGDFESRDNALEFNLNSSNILFGLSYYF